MGEVEIAMKLYDFAFSPLGEQRCEQLDAAATAHERAEAWSLSEAHKLPSWPG